MLVRLAFGALAFGALVLLWELLALQAPHGPASIDAFPEPIAALRSTAFTIGLLALGAAWVAPFAAPDELPAPWLAFAVAGAVGTLGVLGWGAAGGRFGLQLHDPIPSDRTYAWTRVLVQGAATLPLLDLARRVLLRRGAPEPRRDAEGPAAESAAERTTAERAAAEQAAAERAAAERPADEGRTERAARELRAAERAEARAEG